MILGISILTALGCRPAQSASFSPPEPPPAQAAAPAPAPAANTTAASNRRPVDPPLNPPVTVRVSVVGSASDAGILIGMEKGYYREQGINIELSSLPSAQQMVPLLATGQLDVGGGATSAGLLNAVAVDLPIRIVADKGSTPPGFAYQGVVLRNEIAQNFPGCPGFKGLRIATATANSFSPGLERLLRDCGLGLSDVDLTEIPFPDIPIALQNGAIDAAQLLEPILTIGLSNGQYTLWKRTDAFYPDWQNAVLLYGAPFIASNREAGNRFMVAYLKALRDHWDAFARGVNKAEIIDIMPRTSTVRDPSLFERMTPPGLNPDGYINMRSFSDDVEWWINHGYVLTPVAPEQVVDNSFVDYAIERLGRYQPQ